jgi:hypothetical protein
VSERFRNFPGSSGMSHARQNKHAVLEGLNSDIAVRPD